VKNVASSKFWAAYEKLPGSVRKLAGDNFKLLKHDPRHPSPHFKKVGNYWSARVGLRHRAPPLKLTMDTFGSGSALTQIMTSSSNQLAGCRFAERENCSMISIFVGIFYSD
jgi:hypothetical protein